MRAILVRVGVDKAYGNWNAPVDPETGKFVFVPIPDRNDKVYPAGLARKYLEIVRPLADFASAQDLESLCLPPSLVPMNMHLDPDFEHLTYGDNGAARGADIATLDEGDVLAFYAGLRSVAPPNSLVYALIGLFVIHALGRAVDVPFDRRHENAHTRWTPISEQDIVVRGKARLSGRFDRCIPIGEYRDNAYRVRRDIEEAWGGLTVKNGYIQRSAVPPQFKDAKKFYSWFRRQDVNLIGRNN